MDIGDTIAQLEGRFLKPERPRLAQLRALAAAASSVDDLLGSAQGAGIGWPAAHRWYRLTRDRADRLEDPQVRASAPGPPRPVSRRPPTRPTAALYLATAPAMVAAEAAARRFVARAWAAMGIPAPPVDIVWHIAAWGSSPSSWRSRRRLGSLRADAWMRWADELRGGPRMDRVLGDGWTGPFAAVVHAVHDAAEWERGRSMGLVGGDSPAAALIDLWRTGCGIRSVGSDAIALFVPDRADAPARLGPQTRGARVEQAQVDAQLCRAADAGDPVALRRALGRGADPDAAALVRWSQPGSEAHWAGRRFDLGQARRATGPRPWRCWRRCPPPLFLAARRDGAEAVDIVRSLIGAGADAGIGWRDGNVLNHGCRGAGLRLGDLLAAGVPLDAVDRDGRSALHWACRHGSLPEVTALLAAGAPADAIDATGRAPLHLALEHRLVDGVGALLTAGADPSIRTAAGQTVYHLVAMIQVDDAVRQGLVDRFTAAGVPNTADRRGWWPDQLGLGADALAFPPRQGRPGPARPRPAGAPPEALVAAVHRSPYGRQPWLVLADWLASRGDRRGRLIHLHLAEARGDVAHGTAAAALAAERDALLEPIAAADPLGVRLCADPRTRLGFHRGVLWRLGIDAAGYGKTLPTLLGTSATSMIHSLMVRVGSGDDLQRALPQSMWVHDLTVHVDAPGRVRLPSGWPLLDGISAVIGSGGVVDLIDRRVQRLGLYGWGRGGLGPGGLGRLEAPDLRRLYLDSIPATGPGWDRLLELLEGPPPRLTSLTVQPPSAAFLRILFASPLVRRLTTLSLVAIHPRDLDPIREAASELGHLELRLGLIGHGAGRARLLAQLQRDCPGLQIRSP